MLLQFNFENYRSFRKDASLDLTASNDGKLDFHILECAGERVLPLAAIFGANASGKSNVIGAFNAMRNYVLNSIMLANIGPGENYSFVIPFYFDKESKQKVSTFEVYIVVGGYQYKYGFSTFNLDNMVNSEWLYELKDSSENTMKTIFTRNEEGIVDSSLPDEQIKMLSMGFNKRTLLVSLGAQINIDYCKKIWKWFSDCIVMDYGSPWANSEYSRMLPSQFANAENVRYNVVDYLSSFDGSIKDFFVKGKGEKEEEEDKPRFSVSAIHENNGVSVKIPLPWESAGTLKMFSLYQPLRNVLKNGGVLFLDEMNARLHPLLVRLIVCTFLDKDMNTNHAQLVFTSHEPWLLESNLLRQDEIWFTEKQKDEGSELYSLADFGDTKDDCDNVKSVSERYLLGEYGAIPELRALTGLKENNNEGQQ